ncbi:uncharacterized protein LOC106080350 [Biomphalaria glabrata]|uniref:Uncharacterized protein LOC106080350 n=2 Tax=Biomphalaria glabrata TaxID=6526 RepID=A0A9W3B2A8_BIOGL|nr:uncharacterized protein LOC106080350 [Biomphalaria glabrata]KAI8734176.1 hypothetical protein BgiMline_028403 [Biomphalaria glabrata]
MSNGDFLFVWKKCLFITFFKSSKLYLEWMEHSDVLSPSQSQYSGLFTEHSPLGTPFDEELGESLEENVKKISRAVLDISADGIDIFKVDFTFDITTLREVPVILLTCKSREKSKISKLSSASLQEQKQQVYVVGIKETVQAQNKSKMVNEHCSQKGDANYDPSCQKVHFELVKLNVIYIDDYLGHINKSTLCLLSNFQILYINKHLKTLIIHHHDTNCKSNNAQHFKLERDVKTETCFKLVDVFHKYDCGITCVLLLLQSKESTEFISLHISFANKSEGVSQSIAFELRQAPLCVSLSEEVLKIAKHVQIISAASVLSCSTKLEVTLSALVVLTHTGYLLKIVNGAIVSHVNIMSHPEAEACCGEAWGGSCIKIVNLRDLDGEDVRMIAVQIDNFCCLIDLSTEKIVKTWSNVHTVSRFSDQQYGQWSLIVVLLPYGGGHPDKSILYRLNESDIILVDEKNVDENSRQKEKRSNFMHEEEKVGLSEKPRQALLFQEKMCEAALRESESLLHKKMAFLSSAWKRLSQTPAEKGQFSCQESLIPLFESTTIAESDDQMNCERPTVDSHCLLPAAMWRRSLDNLLIVGLTVTNCSTRCVRQVYLKLIPSQCDVTVAAQVDSVSKTGVSRAASLETETALLPGHSLNVFSYVDINQVFDGNSVKLLAFICYQRINTAVSINGPEYIDQFYSEIIVTPEDIINGNDSLHKFCPTHNDTGNKLTSVELQALDVIQTCHNFIVQSLFSSVSCMRQNLMDHPHFLHLEWVKQYIVIASSPLRMCRVQPLEQTSRHKMHIKLYARSQHEILLLVSFLSSLLPKDITIVPEAPKSLFYIQDTGKKLLEKTSSYIRRTREALMEAAEVTGCKEEHILKTDEQRAEDESKKVKNKKASQKCDAGEVPKVKRSKKR